jgi:hypothetical protein
MKKTNVPSRSNDYGVSAAIEYLSLTQRSAIVFFFLAVFVMVWTTVSYAAMKVGDTNYVYSTHNTQFNWLISAAYLSGSTPVICLLLLFIIALVSMLIVTDYLNRETVEKSGMMLPENLSYKFFYIICMYSIHIAVFGIVNALYVYYRGSFDSYVLTTVQVFLAIFDMFYEKSVVRISVRLLSDRFQSSFSELSFIYLRIRLFLHIIVPIISTIALDPLCFGYIYFLPKKLITTSYDSQVCTDFFTLNGVIVSCDGYKFDKFYSTISAPFVYSNQCKNAVITYQIPIIIIGGVLSAFFVPALSLLLMRFRYEQVTVFNISLVDTMLWPTRRPPRLYAVITICEIALQLCYLLVFGMLHPFAAFVIAVNVISIVCLQMLTISRYCP